MMTPATTQTGVQFGRFAQLIVQPSNGGTFGGQGLDLSNLRFRFRVNAADVETPNTAEIRVYNLKDDTRSTILKEFDSVSLTCGYQNANKGMIFQGDIKYFEFGKERNVDSYLDIFAADGDKAYNEGIVNHSFPSGTSDRQTLTTLCASLGLPQTDSKSEENNTYLLTGGILPRGKVMFGMARAYMRDLAKNNDVRWSIQNGQVTLVPVTGYLPGQIVPINTESGMIGTPRATENGIVVRCLLNPLIKIGQRIQINNKDITQSRVNDHFYPSYTSQYYPAITSNNGVYRVLVAEHEGDIRGNDWFTEMTCLAVDISESPTSSVLAQG